MKSSKSDCCTWMPIYGVKYNVCPSVRNTNMRGEMKISLSVCLVRV